MSSNYKPRRGVGGGEGVLILKRKSLLPANPSLKMRLRFEGVSIETSKQRKVQKLFPFFLKQRTNKQTPLKNLTFP